MNKTRQTVTVLFGGKSPEHWVSVKSGLFALLHLDPSRYQARGVYFDQQGKPAPAATCRDAIATFFARNDVTFFGPGETPPADDLCAWLQERAHPSGDTCLRDGGQGDWGLFLPVFHGQGGEDGSIQGFLEFLRLPYGGCNMEGSALGIDKILTKQFCEAAGLAVAPWAMVTNVTWAHDAQACLERCRPLGLPLFIKPARLGSSIGLHRVTRFEELAAAIENALKWDSRILVEAQVPGIEYGIGVAGNQAHPRISAIAESTLRADSFDYDAKYSAGALDDIVPARLDETDTAKLQDFAVKVWRALDMRGIARIDCFLGPQGLVLNEVNTMPGLSAWAPFVMAWRHAGVRAPDLMDLVVREALERYHASPGKSAFNQW